MKTLLAVLITLAAVSTPAQARLGETLEQLKERYGSERKMPADAPFDGAYLFKRNGVTIYAQTIAGRTEHIAYRKADPFQQEEIVKLLEANRGNLQWKELSPKRWARSDGTGADLASSQRSLTIYSQAYLHAKKKAEAVDLEGF